MNNRITVTILLPLVLSFSSVFGMKKFFTNYSYNPDTKQINSQRPFNKNYNSLQDNDNPYNIDERPEKETQSNQKSSSHSKK